MTLYIKLIIVVFAFQTLNAQNYKVTYEARQQMNWTQEQQDEFLEDFTDLVDGKRQMRQNTHSEPVLYELLIDLDKAYSEQKFIPKIRNDQEDNAIITVAPSGFGDLFKKKNEAFYLQKFNVYGKQAIVKENIIVLSSEEAVSTESILGYITELISITDSTGTYKVWYTLELPHAYGPGSFLVKDGFILKMEIQPNDRPGTIFYDAKKVEILKKLKLDKYPSEKDTITADKLNKMYETANTIRNEMYENSSIADD